MEAKQHYEAAGNLDVHNYGMTPDDQKKSFPALIYVLIGALLAFQVVQFILIGLLYLYIHSLEGRLEQDIREGSKEVIRHFQGR